MNRRTLARIFSRRALAHIGYLPVIVSTVKNWWPFTLNYIGLANSTRIYQLRSGLRIHTDEAVDAATIAVIFIKDDYGTIAPDSIVVDIGANIGVFALYAAHTAPGSRVYAYEPMPKTFAVLQKNITDNQFTERITSYPLGVAATVGTRDFYLTDGSPFNSLYEQSRSTGHTVTITTTTLSAILEDNQLEKIDLLKIDCEGAEFEILYATPPHIFAKITEIRLEYHDQDHTTHPSYNHRDIKAFLLTQGYTLTLERHDAGQCGHQWYRRITS
jgi:FkbM family methyltransferase